MLDLALKDIKGHKARTFLTILGIVIAIAAIVSLGSISSGMNSLVEKQMSMLSGLITLEERGAYSGRGPPSGKIPVDELEEIKKISGIEHVAPLYIQQSGAFVIGGGDFELLDFMKLGNLAFKDGGWPEKGEYKIVLGNGVAEATRLNVGDTITIEGEEVEVSGILESANTFMDYITLTTIETAQNLFDDPQHYTFVYIKPSSISEVSSIINEIEDAYPNLDARSTEENVKRAKETISNVRLITLGIGFVTSIVAAIGIINTMFMSISERKKQLGIMKAVGAERRQIIAQVLEEGLILSVIGGIIGILLGFLGTAALNTQIGMPLAKITPWLAVGSFAFSVFITLLSSLYPAFKAAEIDPIEAISSLE